MKEIRQNLEETMLSRGWDGGKGKGKIYKKHSLETHRKVVYVTYTLHHTTQTTMKYG